MRLAIAVSFLFTLFANVAAAEAAPPDRLVRENTDKIISLIKTHRDAYTKDHKKLYAMVNEVVLPHFDFRKMAQLVLGVNWRQANEDQRARFAGEFRDLLVRTYATVLLKYNNEEIVYLPFKPVAGEKTSTVKVEVKLGGGAPPVPIHYDFYLTDTSWKVYDVVIDGISLVTNYRATYADKIKNDGLDALITSLAKGNREGTPVEPVIKPRAKGTAG
jgi:phospholipid transport system substrate-binding protein